MKKERISKQLTQCALCGAGIFLAAKIYAIRELVFLVILFSVAFFLVAGMVCLGLIIFELVQVTLVRIESHMAFGRVALEPSIASTRTGRIPPRKPIVL